MQFFKWITGLVNATLAVPPSGLKIEFNSASYSKLSDAAGAWAADTISRRRFDPSELQPGDEDAIEATEHLREIARGSLECPSVNGLTVSYGVWRLLRREALAETIADIVAREDAR